MKESYIKYQYFAVICCIIIAALYQGEFHAYVLAFFMGVILTKIESAEMRRWEET
jgi:uncharacterized membrane protein YjjP (DUF1212 family)